MKLFFCCNPSCTIHQQCLEQICHQLVQCLKVAADSTIPCRGQGRRPRVAGWSQFVKSELVASQWWYKLWIEAGSPAAGVLFQLKKLAHRRYKYAVRRVRRREEYAKRARLAEALLNDPSRSFWSEVQRFFENINQPFLQSLTMSLAQIILLSCGVIALKSFTILLMVQILMSCWILLNLVSPLLILVRFLYLLKLFG